MEEKSNTGRPADIRCDRIVLITGGSIITLNGVMVNMTDCAPAWATLVNTEDYPGDSNLNNKVYPRERHVGILHEMQIGTVDELVEEFRISLTRAFNSLTCNGNVIPTYGEASLDKQTAVLQRNNLDRFAKEPFITSRENYETRYAKKREALGETPSKQDIFERDVLARLVGIYNHSKDGWHGPTTDHTHVKKLIDALTLLYNDEVARRQQ